MSFAKLSSNCLLIKRKYKKKKLYIILFFLPKLSQEEIERRRIRRERNKQAAAKCRNRRRELTDTLQSVSQLLPWIWKVCQSLLRRLSHLMFELLGFLTHLRRMDLQHSSHIFSFICSLLGDGRFGGRKVPSTERDCWVAKRERKAWVGPRGPPSHLQDPRLWLGFWPECRATLTGRYQDWTRGLWPTGALSKAPVKDGEAKTQNYYSYPACDLSHHYSSLWIWIPAHPNSDLDSMSYSFHG